MGRDLDFCRTVERSISHTYRKELWAPFVQAIKEYKLLQPNDNVAVCISGGKDSILLAKLMQMLQRYSDFPFGLKFIVMDPGYREENIKQIKHNLEKLEITAEFFEKKIFDVADKSVGSPCFICARMRRGALYSKAKELGCNKIALGHHLNDIIETTLIGMMYAGKIDGMLPRIKSTNFENMELIRPMALIKERDIIRWQNYNKLEFIQCACRVAEKAKDGELGSKRQEIKELIADLKKTNPTIETNLFNSLSNANADTMYGYQLDGEHHSFLERFGKTD